MVGNGFTEPFLNRWMKNALQWRPGADDDLTVDNVVALFASIFQRHWGPRIDDVLRVA